MKRFTLMLITALAAAAFIAPAVKSGGPGNSVEPKTSQDRSRSSMPWSLCAPLPTRPTIITLSSASEIEEAPVKLSFNEESELIFSCSFPEYCDPFDLYIALVSPDETLYFSNSERKLVEYMEPYKTDTTGSFSETFDTTGNTLVKGSWQIYWLIQPHGGDWSAYTLGGYSTVAGSEFAKGDQACVLWSDGQWYHAQVEDISDASQRLKVHYTGWEDTWDEWIKEGSALPALTPLVNDTVFAAYKNSYREGRIMEIDTCLYDDGWWYPVQVIDRSEETAKIHYKDYDSSYDEWVQIEQVVTGYKIRYPGIVQNTDDDASQWDEWKGPCDIFTLPSENDYLWGYLSLSNPVYTIILEHTDIDTWQIRYGGYSEWGSSWHEYDDSFTWGDLVPASPEEQKTIQEEFTDHSPLDLPKGHHIYSFYPVESPDYLDLYHVNTPSKIRPIGLGSIVRGGEVMEISFDIPQFKTAVTVYFAMTMDGSDDIYLFGRDNEWHLYQTEGLIPAIEGKTWSSQIKAADDWHTASLAQTTYDFYLIACQDNDFSNAYLWTTSITINQEGYFTGKQHTCTTSYLTELIQQYIQDMEAAGDPDWYEKIKTYVAGYKDDGGVTNPVEALNKLILAFYQQNNLYPFCWAALKQLEQSPSDPWVINSAAVCLLETGETESAGVLLDCAHRFDPELSITHSNGGGYFAEKKETVKALESFKTAVNSLPESPHRAWDAYHFAVNNQESGYQELFLNKIPENYSLKNNDGTTGLGDKKLIVCCNCNDGVYHDLGTCLDECTVTLACFTHICSPRMECCGGNGPFGFSAGFCYPPKGVQVCISVDDQGNTTLKVGSKLGDIISGYVGISSDFKNNHTLFLEGSLTGSAQHTVTMLTTDPKTKNWSSKHQLGYSKSPTGRNSDDNSKSQGLSLGINTTPSEWSKSMLCELYAQ